MTYEDIGRPLAVAIIVAIEGLQKLNIAEDNVLSEEEKKAIDDTLTLITHNLEELKKLDYYDLSETKAARDITVEFIRIICVELHNELGEIEWAIKLTDFAKKIVASDELNSKINDESIIISILKTLKDLSTLDATADGVLDKEEKKIINDSVMFLKDNFKELKKIDSYDTEIMRVIRDTAANVIRNMAIELTNELQKVGKSQELIIFAQRIACADELKKELRKDLRDLYRLQENKRFNIMRALINIVVGKSWLYALFALFLGILLHFGS